MHTQTQAHRKLRTKKDRKPLGNWMQLEIAPLIAERMKKRQPFPGKGQ